MFSRDVSLARYYTRVFRSFVPLLGKLRPRRARAGSARVSTRDVTRHSSPERVRDTRPLPALAAATHSSTKLLAVSRRSFLFVSHVALGTRDANVKSVSLVAPTTHTVKVGACLGGSPSRPG